MSAYGVISGGGDKPTAELVVKTIKSKGVLSIPRYRDAWIEKNNADNLVLVVYTRTGGGNRECYCDDYDPDNKQRNSTGHMDSCYEYMNGEMAKHPLYIEDKDDDFDSTYAKFYFEVPEGDVEKIKQVFTQEQDAKNPPSLADKMDTFKESLSKMTPDQIKERYPVAVNILKRIEDGKDSDVIIVDDNDAVRSETK